MRLWNQILSTNYELILLSPFLLYNGIDYIPL